MKTNLLRTIVLLLVCAYANAQNFEIGHKSITVVDNSRNARNIALEIYYPSDVAGDDVAFPASSTQAFPLVAFGHGFVMGWQAYQNIWEALVPQGVVVAFPKTEGGILPSHLEFGKDLSFVIDQLTLQSGTASDFFYNRISDQSVVMGHSMGGGAAFIAAQLNTNIDAIAVLAPAETNPSAIAAAAAVSVPALVLAGSNDCVTPPSENQIPMYDGLSSECKTYIEISGGSHCQMAESNFLCEFGESTCSPSATITRSEQHLVISDYLVKWLKAQLLADCSAGAAFNSQIASDNRITFEKNCSQCEILANKNFESFEPVIYPNPFDNRVYFELPADTTSQLMIYDFSGRMIIQSLFKGKWEWNTDELAAGIYFYNIRYSGMQSTGKLIKQH